MTRGRRKDLTIPPSRALLQQRDYRARKAQYVADLEDRVRRAEDDNARLRKELEAMRLRLAAGGSLGPSPEVVAASSELMHQLTTAAATLAKFQQIAFNEQAQAQAQAQAHALAQAQMQTQNLQPPPPPPKLPPIQSPLHDQHPPPGGFTLPPPQTSRQSSPPRTALHPSAHQQMDYHHHHSLSPPTSRAAPPPSAVRDFPHLPPPEPQRQAQQASALPPSLSPRASTSSAPPPPSTPSGSRMSISHRARTYAEYSETESAWGYFDSQDLAEDEEDEEDELYEDERDHGSGAALRHRMQDPRSALGGHANGHGHGHGQERGSSVPPVQDLTTEAKVTRSLVITEDSPMRMREDSPMRTR